MMTDRRRTASSLYAPPIKGGGTTGHKSWYLLTRVPLHLHAAKQVTTCIQVLQMTQKLIWLLTQSAYLVLTLSHSAGQWWSCWSHILDSLEFPSWVTIDELLQPVIKRLMTFIVGHHWWQHWLKLASSNQLFDDVQTSNQLPLDIQLWICWPVGIFF